MTKYYDVVIGYAYPTAGSTYRVFDGVSWHDCDKYGKVKNNCSFRKCMTDKRKG